MKKAVFLIAFLTFSLFSGVSLAQNAGWIGTSWIVSGSIIQSVPLKSNLDWLNEFKVHKPFDCNADNERLAFENGEWGCKTVAVVTGPNDNCTFSDSLVLHGSTVPAYETATVPFGETCNQEIRTCTDGVLSGSFTAPSCQPLDPGACVFAGEPVAHGTYVSAYESQNVAVGETCQSENRLCTNGELDGSYEFQTCTVADPEPEEPVYDPIPLSALWVTLPDGDGAFTGPGGTLRNNCAAGATPTGLRDDSDSSRTLTEDNYNGNTAQLCLAASGVTILSEWRAGSCSAGMTHTGIYDTDHDWKGGYTNPNSKYYQHKHDLNEENHQRNDILWCVGVEDPANAYEVQVDRPHTTSCGSGWTKIVNARNNNWNVNTEDGDSNRSLCMRVVPRGYTGGSSSAAGNSGGSGGGGNANGVNINAF